MPADGETTIEIPLVDGRSFKGRDSRGKPLLLKILPEDCLHRQQLHPAIKDRLVKIRDLPHPRAATLRGVERFDVGPFLVWNFVDGAAWTKAVSQESPPSSDLPHQLISAVELLHSQGLVHGNLHGNNVVITAESALWLTDFSPYLYDDPAVDIASVLQLLIGQTAWPVVSEAASRFAATGGTFRELADALAEPAGGLAGKGINRTTRQRWRWLVIAMISVIAVTTGLWLRHRMQNG